MALCDEIVAGLVDPQIREWARRGSTLSLIVEDEVRALWQAWLVAVVAKDEDDSIDWLETPLGRRRLSLHDRGPYETAPEDEIVAELGPVTFHRPLGRLAVERTLVAADPRRWGDR